MPIETRPKNPLPKGPRPGSRYPPYPVTDKDTLETVAQHFSIPLTTLLLHNFATLDPAEINWYLRENVGCKVMTADKKNWCFSDSAKPGYMYAPALGKHKPDNGDIGIDPPQDPASPADQRSQNWSAASLGSLDAYEFYGGGIVAMAFRNNLNHAKFYYVGLRAGAGYSFDPAEKIKEIKLLLKALGFAVLFGKAVTANWVPVTASQPFSASDIDGCDMDCLGMDLNSGGIGPAHNWSREDVTLRELNDKIAFVRFKGTSWWELPGIGAHASGGILIRVW